VQAGEGVRERLKFVAGEMKGTGAASYTLRGSGLTVEVRHGTRDVYILSEIFGTGPTGGSYDPPAAVAAALDATATPAVMDLGGNIGLFGAFVLGRWPGASVHSFEPDPTNFPILERLVAVNSLAARWTVTPLAVANAPGELPFVSGLYAESQLEGIGQSPDREPDAAVLSDGETITVGVVDLFEQDHNVALMKMDIEGGEWSILTDPRMSGLRAGAIVLEWHAAGCPEPDAREATIELLRAAGYTGQSETENFGHRGVIWAWREGSAASA
jgi:FkbM family methyltransferase